ncbi:alpha/beta fold hydrolase [Robertmurraya massiliosenegalensis]|uniref:alpha/beta fold hydrolase n=1 Tax=Robertmurraya massiliosenegalensis TaxID=1287657 RepID=UPI0002F483E6|nr:alpha/beta hydrolase [Robertmurraya massiliosenegalensis]
MNIRTGTVEHDGVNIHFTEVNRHLEGTPFVIIPGLSESADDYTPFIDMLSPRHTVIITLRGRGASSSPETGYTLSDHVNDICAIIQHLNLEKYVLFGFSRGVSYTIGFALQNTTSLRGLIIGDYPAIHSALPPGWAEFYLTLPPWRGKPILERITKTALIGIERDSSEVFFWEELHNITCPALIIQGGMKGSILSSEDGKRYLKNLPNAEWTVFKESDHNIFEPDVTTFIETIDNFLINKVGV